MPLADAKAVKSVQLQAGKVLVEVQLGFPLERARAELEGILKRLLDATPEVGDSAVSVRWTVASHAVQGGLQPLPGIANVVAVASGKGGVGKSTTAVNLALALALDGARVGLLDADIYGPSQPRMVGLQGQRPVSEDGKRMEPLVAHGIKVMSIGFLIEEEQPMVWRGPMVTQALTQLLSDTNWGELDYLVVDMPPGTGDIQLTLAQRVPVSGAVVVTTPQDIALLDARKGLRMFQKVAVPVLGIVENMSTHVCSKCGHEEPVFGSGGGARMAEQYGVDLLASLPLDIRIREETDSGRPTVVADPDGPIGRAYLEMARRTAARLSLAAATGVAAPKITVEET
jgi:ATP-binding protein involved in chromosome partitioning